jgi:hypothetical protein
MLKEIGLEAFLVCLSIGPHSSSCSPDVSLREKVTLRGGRDTSGGLSKNVIKGMFSNIVIKNNRSFSNVIKLENSNFNERPFPALFGSR